MIDFDLLKNVPADDFEDRWLLWTWGPKGANGKRRKVPCKVDDTFHTLDAADAHKDDGQMSLPDAIKAAAGFPNKVAGVGYCLREDDGLLFVDCDGCFDESGNLHADVQKMVDMSKPCFVEKSVSGNGIHIIGYGDNIPPRAGHKSETPNGAEVERYTDKRFICITGNIIGDPVHKLTSLDDLAGWLTETTFTRAVMEPKPRLELDRDEPHDVAVALHCLGMLADKRKQDEQEWFRVASACAEISDELQEPFEEFSKSAGADYYNPQDGLAKFEQCLRAPSYSGEPQRGVGTLVAMAAEDTGKTPAVIIAEATEKLGRDRKGFQRVTTADSAEEFKLDINDLPYPEASRTTAVPFPVEHLPDIPRRFVQELSKAVGCHESMPALFTLGALSSAVCSSVELSIKRKWVCQPILWCAAISESGSCKSPVESACLSPVRRRQTLERAEHGKLAAQFAEDAKLWNARRKAAEKKGEPFEEEAPFEPGECPQRWVSDSTAEAIALMMSENPRGVLFAVDELTGLLGSFNRYNSGRGDEALFLAAHKASPHEHKRKTGDKKTISIERAALSITGGIQPAIARQEFSLERRYSGMVPRFLMAMPPRTHREWTEADVSEQAELLYDGLFDGLYDIPLIDCQPVRVTLSPEAKAAFIEWHREHSEHSADAVGEVTASMSKIEELPARLALLFHCISHAADCLSFNLEPVLPVHHMEAGIAVARWFRHEAERTYQVLEYNDIDFIQSVVVDKAAARVLKILRDAATPLQREDIFTKLPKGKVTPRTTLAALADLVARGDCFRDTQAGEYFFLQNFPTNRNTNTIESETPTAATTSAGDFN